MTSTKKSNKKWSKIGAAALLTALLLFGCVIGKAFVDGEFSSVESFRSYMEQFGIFAPILLVLIQAVQVVLPVLPGFFGCAVGSLMFGAGVSFWCNYIGIAAGSIIAFFLARRYGMPLVQALFPMEKYRKWSGWISKSKAYTAMLFLAMLLPLFPDDYLCYLTGVSGMKAKRFIWIILLGKPWCILAYCVGFSLIQ